MRWKPTSEQLLAARGKTIPAVLAADLRVLFCGINPSLYSGAVGHHFARPGNRFWKVLHAAGFTTREVSPFDDRALLASRLGVTNLVERATATAGELRDDELRAGAERLTRAVRRYQPGIVAVLGVAAYRVAFGHPKAAIGPQPRTLGSARLWVLPNPSGLNAHYQLDALTSLFFELRRASETGEQVARRRGAMKAVREDAMEEKKAPFGNGPNEDTLTSSIPTRERQETTGSMPDPVPDPAVDDLERAQIPTKVDDSGTTRRAG